jgi:hypothetical protein
MGYWDSINWESLKKDIQKGWKEGAAVVKEGAVVAKKKAGELTDEGMRRYKAFELKTKVHKRVYDLGERVHKLMAGRQSAKNPALDAQVKTIMTDIRKMEAQISKLSGAPSKKTAAKRKRK